MVPNIVFDKKEKQMSLKVKFKLIHLEAKEPFKKYTGDAGYDLYAVEDVLLSIGIPTIVHTGICLKTPEGYYSEIHTRSSHGKEGIRCHLGVVDETYHGEVCPIMTSHFKEYRIKKGDRIAQLVFKKRIGVKFIKTDEEFTSDRGTDGFGSTGK